MRSQFQQRAQNFKALGDALKSGDLAGAQKAFDTIQANAPKNGANSGSGTGNSQNPLSNDFNALGTALQSGDLASAQKAFATLQQDGQAMHKAHGHHHHGGSTDAAQSAQATQGITLPNETEGSVPTGFGNATLDVSA